MSAQEQTTIEVFKKLASTFAEAIYLPASSHEEQINVFGRKVAIRSEDGGSVGLSYLLGKAVSGLRCSALLDSDQLQNELQNLSTFNRLHVPLSLVVMGNGGAYLTQLIQTGSILFKASNIQELADYILIAQVISEKCLTPVVVLGDFLNTDNPFSIPSNKELVHWFGNPDEKVKDPTITQETVLGTARRRMPAWLHIDQAVLVGAKKEAKMKALEKAAYQQFDQNHYRFLIKDSLLAFSKLTGRAYKSHQTVGSKKPKHLVVSTSVQDGLMFDSAVQKSLEKEKAQLICLNQLNPIPYFDDTIGKYVERTALLEPIAASAQHGQYFASFCVQKPNLKGYKENGWFADSIDASSVLAALRHLQNKESKSQKYWLDIPLSKSSSKFPKHEILLQQINRDYPEIEHVSVISKKEDNSLTPTPAGVPDLIRRYANQGPPYAKISRFYDDTFCLHEYAKEELIADPFQAYPVMPIATASFKSRQEERELIPVFKPKACKNIDELVLSCSFGALPSSLLTVSAFINHGIELGRKQGENVSQITPILKKWVKSAIAEVKKNKDKITVVKDFLNPSIEDILSKSKFDEEKTNQLKAEAEIIIKQIGEIAIVADQKLFVEQERREAGTGELFTLAVNPMTCTGCGHCALVGEDPCMSLKPQEEHLPEVFTAFNRFETLPATSNYSIEKLIEREDFDPFAALLLNSKLYHTFSATTGGDLSQDETVIKYFLALTEYHIRPKLNSNIEVLDSTIKKLNNGIKELLSSSLPVNQLDALMSVLTKHEESRVNMTQVFEEWGAETSFSSIEKKKLERKLQLLEELKILRANLDKGISGFGRPSCSIVLDKSLAKMASYPYNPFTAPVLVSESANTAALTHGVCEGQLRHGLDQIRLQRRAELEASDRYMVSKHDEELANLSWNDLSVEEQQCLPPVVLLATNRWLQSCNLTELSALLQNPYPVKIFIINKGLNPKGDLLAQMHSASNSMWSLVAQGNTFITQAGLYHRAYLYGKMKRSLNFNGNAIVNVLAPDVSSFDIHPAHWMQLSALASSARAFLQWTFQPEIPTASIASKLFTEVESIEQDFQLVQLEYLEEGESKVIEYAMTWADWAYLAHDLKKYFTEIGKTEQVILVKDYLNLNLNDRVNYSPAIIRVDAQGAATYYQVASKIIEVCALSLDKLNTLREWAGLYTEFPDKLRSQVNEELAKDYEKKKGIFEKEMKEKMAAWESNYLSEMKEKIKDKLLNMSGM
jgi:NAD-dependent dihydropyrimidine dehydrogenase PreA subunit